MSFDIQIKSQSDFRSEMKKVLQELCESIQFALLKAGSKTLIQVIPGFITDYGQEYRLLLHAESSGIPIDFVLLRLHLPMQQDARLDIYGELTLCSTPQVLRQKLTEFIEMPQTQQTLTEWSEFGR